MRRLPILWTAEARRNLEEIVAYVAADAPDRADQFARRLVRSVGRLERFPHSGKAVPELADQSPAPREILFGLYRVIYVVLDDNVAVMSIVHGRRLR